MDKSYETYQFIPLLNDEDYELTNCIKDSPFYFFIDDIEIERITMENQNPVIFSNNDNIYIEINKNEDFSKSGNTKDNSIKPICGRKRKNPIKEGEKLHDKNSFDNILTKINSHFLNFLIIFINEVLRNCNIDGKFHNINYQNKIISNQKHFHKIINKTIAYFLILKNDEKYNDCYHNKDLYDKISKNNNKILNNILTKKYIDIFKGIYFNNKKNIIYEGMKLNLSKTFDNFIEEKVAKEDFSYKKRIYEAIQKFYFCWPFIVKKNKK